MRLLPFSSLKSLLGSVLFLASSCTPSASSIVLSVEPNPILLRPFAFGHGVFGYVSSMKFTVRETAGLGGHIELLEITGLDATTRQVIETAGPARAGPAQITVRSGTNYVESNGSLAVEMGWGGPFLSMLSESPRLVFICQVRFLDDRGNTLTKTIEVPEAMPREGCSPGVPGCPAR